MDVRKKGGLPNKKGVPNIAILMGTEEQTNNGFGCFQQWGDNLLILTT